MAGANQSPRRRKSQQPDVSAFHFVDPSSPNKGRPQPPPRKPKTPPMDADEVIEAIPAQPLELEEIVEAEVLPLEPTDYEIVDAEMIATETAMPEIPFTFDLDEPQSSAAVAEVPFTFDLDEPTPAPPPPPPLPSRPPQQPAMPALSPIQTPVVQSFVSPSSSPREATRRRPKAVEDSVRRSSAPPVPAASSPQPRAGNPPCGPSVLEAETGLIPEHYSRRRPGIKITVVTPGGASPVALS
ncbi:MAG: hypothetical protein RMJ56_18295 [Gemmataceae bacterium]|nr:hypothetical protein [Gemmata sp.]MDW8199548.1 hypothetical protein [Gemmataceae bacterium]